MNEKKLFEHIPVRALLSILLSFVLIFLLYETIYLEKKIEKHMYKISTTDVVEITENIADSIKHMFTSNQEYVKTIKSDTNLQEKIDDKLQLLLTKNIKYAYLLYRDKKDTFRFLGDASSRNEKAFINQKFDIDSAVWFDIYKEKKSILIKHDLLKSLSITLIVPIIKQNEVKLLLVIDFSLDKIEGINDIISIMKNGIIIILLILFFFLIVLIYQMINYQKVKKSAFVDQLTNVYNRNYLEEYQDTIELKNYVVAIADIDFFKKVNDTYGHDAGDIVLKEVANIIKTTIRITHDDMVIRFGGEEFIILIRKSEKNKKILSNILNRIRKNIETYEFYITETKHINVTVSIGLNLEPSRSKNFTEAFKIADAALYEAKNSGRNNVKSVH